MTDLVLVTEAPASANPDMLAVSACSLARLVGMTVLLRIVLWPDPRVVCEVRVDHKNHAPSRVADAIRAAVAGPEARR